MQKLKHAYDTHVCYSVLFLDIRLKSGIKLRCAASISCLFCDWTSDLISRAQNNNKQHQTKMKFSAITYILATTCEARISEMTRPPFAIGRSSQGSWSRSCPDLVFSELLIAQGYLRGILPIIVRYKEVTTKHQIRLQSF